MLCEMWNNLINVPNNVEKVNAKMIYYVYNYKLLI